VTDKRLFLHILKTFLFFFLFTSLSLSYLYLFSLSILFSSLSLSILLHFFLSPFFFYILNLPFEDCLSIFYFLYYSHISYLSLSHLFLSPLSFIFSIFSLYLFTPLALSHQLSFSSLSPSYDIIYLSRLTFLFAF